MQWPNKAVSFHGVEGSESRLDYWMSATNSGVAERTPKERSLTDDVFGNRVAGGAPGKKHEAEWGNLPPNCLMLLA
jgi:hypothetical protein